MHLRALGNASLGKETRGYDPTNDIVWLRSEIVSWIEGNLLEKWYVPCQIVGGCLIFAGPPSSDAMSQLVSLLFLAVV